MALFTKKTEEKKDAPKAEKAVTKTVATPTSKDLESVLLNARITEKSTISVEKSGAYVFDVAPAASKKDIKEAVAKIFKVTPVKIRIAKIPSKKVYRRGHVGVKSGGKKAYVFLKKGDKIEFV